MKKSDHYLPDLLQSEDRQLQKLHEIIKKAVIEEELVTKKIAEGEDDDRTVGEKMSDAVSQFGGSWKFIILFISLMMVWIIYNSVILLNRSFDPYPYIFLNLILSCVAAIQAPIIMMSQNRQETKDRSRAVKDYMVNLKSEIEIRNLHEKMDLSVVDQYRHLCEIQQKQIELLETINTKLSTLKKP